MVLTAACSSSHSTETSRHNACTSPSAIAQLSCPALLFELQRPCQPAPARHCTLSGCGSAALSRTQPAVLNRVSALSTALHWQLALCSAHLHSLGQRPSWQLQDRVLHALLYRSQQCAAWHLLIILKLLDLRTIATRCERQHVRCSNAEPHPPCLQCPCGFIGQQDIIQSRFCGVP